MAISGIGGNTTALTGAVLTVYSREIIFQAQPLLRFMQFAEIKDELGVAPGNQITFLKYSDLSAGGALTEGTDMTQNALSSSQINITVNEWGYAIQVSEKLLQLSFDDVLQSGSKMLGHNMAKTVDGDLRDTVVGTSNVLFANSKTARTDISAGDYFDTALIKDAVESLAVAKAPKVNGDAYVCFLHPHQARRLRDDSAWINAADYGSPGQLFIGEIGRYEDVIFIETTMTRIIKTDLNIFADGVDTTTDATSKGNVDVYESIIFGDNAFGEAVALAPELRDNGVQDFGRRHGLAWYAIRGSGRIEGGHVYRLESA